MPGGMLSGCNDGFVNEDVLKVLNTADIRIGTLETAIGNEPNCMRVKCNVLAMLFMLRMLM